MKKIRLKSLLLLLMFIGLMGVFIAACKKESDEITAIITVKAQWDTLVVIPYADVVIGKDFNDVKVTGKTDASGVFKTTFKLEAILDVTASLDTNTVPPYEPALTGVAVIRLKPGQTVYKTVFIR